MYVHMRDVPKLNISWVSQFRKHLKSLPWVAVHLEAYNINLSCR